MTLIEIRDCFSNDRIYYTRHARDEMLSEEFGEIKDHEVYEAVLQGNVIESYAEDEPYPSCLIFGRTTSGRPLHVVCAHDKESGIVIIITVYEPDPNRWIEFERRKI